MRNTVTVPAAQLPKIQHSLPMFHFLCREFGAGDFEELRSKIKDTLPDTNDQGQSLYFDALKGVADLRVPLSDFTDYDRNILAHVDSINRSRNVTVRLAYFQYLCALFTERLLHRRAADRDALLAELNKFVEDRNGLLAAEGKRWRYLDYADADLNKFAFWSATGSGKTLLMHLHLHQWRHYAKPNGGAASVLLLTPNEDLSRQHKEEFALSEIRAARYGETDFNLFSSDSPAVTITEITKINEKAKGKGKSANLDEFENFGLVLIDEGHRGASGDVWRDTRARIAPTALKLEYSATFGQVVNGAPATKKPELWAEYHRAIAFDYAYPRFKKDGYGKDYHIVNVDDAHGDSNDYALLGSLLSFYEQAAVYETASADFKPFNLSRPLWVFVGNTVTGSKDAEAEELTDVQQVAAFFHDFLKSPHLWIPRIEKMLTGRTGLLRGDGKDLFHECLLWVKAKSPAPADLYAAVLRVVFHGQQGDTLRASLLKNAPGEIALSVGSASEPFAVINVGSASTLRDRLRDGSDIPADDDALSASRFAALADPDSPIRVLIGSRKFMEGWNSFRVSSIGLMNLGRTEGSQIIQLFGRGVRLLGYNYGLKRTRELKNVPAPANIEILETLNVYGIRANYMSKFREALQNEGIETDFVEISVPLVMDTAFLNRGLAYLKAEGAFDESIAACVNPTLHVGINLRPKVEVADSRHGIDAGDTVAVPPDTGTFKTFLPFLSWSSLLCALQEYRREKGLQQVAFTEQDLRDILNSSGYKVECPPGYFDAPAAVTLQRAQDVALSLLRKYIAVLYDRRKSKWETENLVLVPLTKETPNLAFGGYTVKVAESETALVAKLQALAQSGSDLYRKDITDLPNLHFADHLYQPLLTNVKKSSTGALTNLPGLIHHPTLETAGIASVSPPGLEDSEVKFLWDLRQYVAANPDALAGRELFLLRNQSRGTGDSFFDFAEGEAFYPDFLLWLLTPTAHYLTFVDPHGIRNSKGFDDPKHTLWRFLQNDVEPRVQPPAPALPIRLNAFIIAPDSYAAMRSSSYVRDHTQPQWEAHHVLFQVGSDYISKLFAGLNLY